MSVNLRPFSADEYEAMTRSGLLGEDDRCELLEGEIIEMSPIGSRHASVVARLTELLIEVVARAAIIWTQNPVRLNDFSEPQPDVAVLRRDESRYAGALPVPTDIQVLIEVSDTSLEVDRTIKLPLYARNGIPTVWLINLADDVVEAYTDPIESAYATQRVARRGERLSLPRFPDSSMSVDDVLGAAAG
ncbi:MAG: Uma2 family endonuclease [Chloroflexi bacterium]|nr:Uma2 family endonuclease [Chloroflexota bacterium]